MIDTIHKFPLSLCDAQFVWMPTGARIIKADVQNGSICLWAEVDSQAKTQQARDIKIVGTGRALPKGDLTHLGSVIVPPFVWHIYESGYELIERETK